MRLDVKGVRGVGERCYLIYVIAKYALKGHAVPWVSS